MSNPIRMGLVGLGKIARDEHLPAIAFTEGAQLVAVTSRNAAAEGVANYPDLAAMLAGQPDIDAVILCQPPQVRYAAARAALLAGKHVFLEKPPGATLSEVEALVDLAHRQGVTLYASWHSRYSASVAEARAWCAAHAVTGVEIIWKEDVRRWHPGQDWIWEAGGFGVFDPGINALSILTEVLDDKIRLVDATLYIPANHAAPIAADLVMATADGVPITAAFDWRQTGPQVWQILFEAGDEKYLFAQGGDDAANTASGKESAISQEYRAMYRRFVDLVRSGSRDVDVAPLQLVADACLRGTYHATEPFEDQ
jgi:D-galactose 1-dehydrogenase